MFTDFGDKPLVVLTAGAETDPTHDAAQTQLATLSTDSSHRVIKGASHAGLINEEQYAQTTTRAVLDVVASVRSDTQLAQWSERPNGQVTSPGWTTSTIAWPLSSSPRPRTGGTTSGSAAKRSPGFTYRRPAPDIATIRPEARSAPVSRQCQQTPPVVRHEPALT
jgi:hypothetical protein